jgi:WXXGXW repeat (2 copies)
VTPPVARAAALLALAGVLAGCVASLPEAGGAPPSDPLPEVRSLPPAPGMVWVGGSWHWDGRDWAWIPGRWEAAPPPR